MKQLTLKEELALLPRLAVGMVAPLVGLERLALWLLNRRARRLATTKPDIGQEPT